MKKTTGQMSAAALITGAFVILLVQQFGAAHLVPEGTAGLMLVAGVAVAAATLASVLTGRSRVSGLRRRAEAALRETADQLAIAKSAAKLGIYDYDVTTGRIGWDARVRFFWGAGPDEEITLERFMQGLHPEDREPTAAALADALSPQGDGSFFSQYRVCSASDGVTRWVEATGRAFFEGDRPVRLVGTVQDITARKDADAALRLSEERFRRAADAVDGIIYDADMTTGRVVRSRGLFEVVGYDPAEVPDTVDWWWSQVHPDDLRTRANLESQGLESSSVTVRYRVRHRHGYWIHLEDRSIVTRDESGAVLRITGCAMDVTDNVAAAEELRQSEARFRQLADSVPQLVWVMRPDGYHEFCNRRWTEYYGRMPGRDFSNEWIELLHPDDRERTIARWQESAATGIPYEIEYRLRAGDGSFRWFLAQAMPVRDAAGEIVRWFGTCTDVHDQRTSQEVLVETASALREADRRKDEFLAILAHELRNPLAPLRSALHVLKLGPAIPSDGPRALEIMERQIGHLVRLIDDLMDVSRISRGKIALQRSPVSLRRVVLAGVETARPIIEECGHTLVVEPIPEGVTIDADETRLAQVFANLLNNAAKYTPTGGRLEVVHAVAGGFASVAVRDNGDGIPPAVLPRVFDLFTQAGVPGTHGGLGIGLSIVKGLVELHGGRVEARSAGPGSGSEFVVSIPIAKEPPALEPRGRVAGAPPMRVLVADDNRDSAMSLRMLLELLGHAVETAADGREAVERFRVFSPDLVLLDIGMPEMNGYEACRCIRTIEGARAVTIVALTGWGQENDKRSASAAGFDDHVVKPIDPERLEALLFRCSVSSDTVLAK